MADKDAMRKVLSLFVALAVIAAPIGGSIASVYGVAYAADQVPCEEMPCTPGSLDKNCVGIASCAIKCFANVAVAQPETASTRPSCAMQPLAHFQKIASLDRPPPLPPPQR